MSASTRLLGSDYVAFVAVESARFTDLLDAQLSAGDPAVRVPACPDWDAADLLWHLTEVQWFWGSIVSGRLDAPDAAEADKPARPADTTGLVRLSRAATERLVDTLATGADDDPVWTWDVDDRTRGFVRRRQAHEALIHRLDAEQVAGRPSPLDPALATDGVDEALGVLYGGTPSWGRFERLAGPIAVVAADTGASWSVDVGRLTGTVPGTGEQVDEPSLMLRDEGGSAPLAQVRADAGTLDGWLWGRLPPAAVTRSGDTAALAALDEAVGDGVQ